MKNKKSLLSLGLLALVLVLGVGYAVVSNVELTFGGTASVEEAALKVTIENATHTEGATVNHTIATDKKSASFEVSDMELKKPVQITYTVKNSETDVKALLTQKTALSGNTQYFNASYDINNATIDANGTTTVTVTVEMVKTPISEADSSAKFEFVLDAAPVSQ